MRARALISTVVCAITCAACAPRAAHTAAVAPPPPPARVEPVAPVASASPTPPPAPSVVAPPPSPCVEAQAPAAPGAPPAADDDLDDGVEIAPPPPDANATNATSALDAISDADLEAKLAADPASLGTISLGSIHSGALLYGVQMPAGDHWQVVVPAQSYGAKETVEALARAIDAVAAEFPDTPKAFIGDISRQGGGHFPPHVSHQSGRDVDMSYYLKGDAHRWYATATAQNLDLPRTWALVKALLTQSDVELLLMDRGVQRLVKDYALSIGEDRAWLDDVFQIDATSRRPIVIHVPGHASHLHVRFWAAESRELGRRAYAFLMRKRLIKPPTYYVDHVVRAHETLGTIAARYKVSVEALRRANHLASSVVVRGRTIKIPRAGGIERPAAKVVAPARRLPPPKAVAAASPPPRDPCARAAN